MGVLFFKKLGCVFQNAALVRALHLVTHFITKVTQCLAHTHIWEAERERQLPSASLLPKCFQQLGSLGLELELAAQSRSPIWVVGDPIT